MRERILQMSNDSKRRINLTLKETSLPVSLKELIEALADMYKQKVNKNKPSERPEIGGIKSLALSRYQRSVCTYACKTGFFIINIGA